MKRPVSALSLRLSLPAQPSLSLFLLRPLHLLSICFLRKLLNSAWFSLLLDLLYMGSMLGNLPSYDPHNFSQLRPSDPGHASKLTPATYHPTHSRTVPPPNQVISTEATNILLRQFYQRSEKKLRPKRAASDHLAPEHGCKQLRGCFTEDNLEDS